MGDRDERPTEIQGTLTGPTSTPTNPGSRLSLNRASVYLAGALTLGVVGMVVILIFHEVPEKNVGLFTTTLGALTALLVSTFHVIFGQERP